jgi:hypothetical protein
MGWPCACGRVEAGEGFRFGSTWYTLDFPVPAVPIHALYFDTSWQGRGGFQLRFSGVVEGQYFNQWGDGVIFHRLGYQTLGSVGIQVLINSYEQHSLPGDGSPLMGTALVFTAVCVQPRPTPNLVLDGLDTGLLTLDPTTLETGGTLAVTVRNGNSISTPLWCWPSHPAACRWRRCASCSGQARYS